MHTRTVFFVSDGTGITAETFGNAILAQFEFKPRHVRLPFIDTVDKAHQVVRQVNHTAEVEGRRPVVFTTLVNVEVLQAIEDGCRAMGCEPARIALVGDSLANDVEGALAAGMVPIWVDRFGDGYSPGEGVYRIETLFELPELLRSLR